MGYKNELTAMERAAIKKGREKERRDIARRLKALDLFTDTFIAVITKVDIEKIKRFKINS